MTLSTSSGKAAIFAEIWQFMRVRKKWWLLPIILILAQGSVLAPLIYTIF